MTTKTLKPTLGPWHVESKEFPYVLNEKSEIVATLPFTDQGRADAPLVAIAPELLEIAQWLGSFMLKAVDGGQAWCAIRERSGAMEWFELLKTTLAKAEAP